MTVTLHLNSEVIHDTFRTWNAERESLDSQLSESLEALSAYQSHLDAWQERIAQERGELQTLRGQIDRDRAALENTQAQISAEAEGELDAASEKISSLTAALLERTDELRALDNRRAQAVTELELSRARESELRSAVEEQKRTTEQERAHWAEEFRRLRELLERQLESPPTEEPVAPSERHPAPVKRPRSASASAETNSENPVLGSIVEQFGKLRQQRAFDRQSVKRPR